MNKKARNYDDLLNDEDIDVVYIGWVEHKNLAAKSIKAGKTTVVETPLALS